MSKSGATRKLKESGMTIYCLADKRHYPISELEGVKVLQSNGRSRIVGVTPSGHKVSRFISKQMAGSGLLGKLFNPGTGELFPGSSNIPLLGMLL